jgi:LysM repeat protein
MEGVLDNLTSEHATDDINKTKSNIEYKEEIKEEIKDVTTVQLGNTMQEITKQTSVQANDLPKMHLEELNKDKKDFKSKDSYISRLFSNYGA